MPVNVEPLKDQESSLITIKYKEVLESHPELGEPATNEIHVWNSDWYYREYKGGASIYASPGTGAFLLTGLIRTKWVAMGRETGPNHFPLSDVKITDKARRGWICKFQHGAMAVKNGDREAFTVYGEIYKKWTENGGVNGPLGFPLTDEKDYVVGNKIEGRWNSFDHGAIFYLYAAKKAIMVRSPILEAWILKNRENGWLKYPVTDSVGTLILGEKQSPRGKAKKLSQTFQGGSIECFENHSISIVSPTISSKIDPVNRTAIITDPAESSDNRIYPLINLDSHPLRLKTACVIFKKSVTRQFSLNEITSLKKDYQLSTDKLKEFSFGLARIQYDVIIIDAELTKQDFNDLHDSWHLDENVFYAEFTGYDKVRTAMEKEGKSIDSYDIVSIHIPWEDSDKVKSAWFAWANCYNRYRWGNNKTWSTVHHVYTGPYWWAYHLHESMHCIEWMLEDLGYPELRNNDDKWWLRSYPVLYSSTVSPPPVNLWERDGDLLFAIISRIKEHWQKLVPKWGTMISAITFPATETDDILVYSCPDQDTLIETSVKANYVKK